MVLKAKNIQKPAIKKRNLKLKLNSVLFIEHAYNKWELANCRFPLFFLCLKLGIFAL